MEQAVAKFGAYFHEKGLVASDIPTAIVIHEVLGLAMAVSAWTVSDYPSRNKTAWLWWPRGRFLGW
jgi:hypothetical protein